MGTWTPGFSSSTGQTGFFTIQPKTTGEFDWRPWNSTFLDNLLRNLIPLPLRVETIAGAQKHSRLETESTSRGSPLFLFGTEQQEFPDHLCSFVWFSVYNKSVLNGWQYLSYDVSDICLSLNIKNNRFHIAVCLFSKRLVCIATVSFPSPGGNGRNMQKSERAPGAFSALAHPFPTFLFTPGAHQLFRLLVRSPPGKEKEMADTQVSNGSIMIINDFKNGKSKKVAHKAIR